MSNSFRRVLISKDLKRFAEISEAGSLHVEVTSLPDALLANGSISLNTGTALFNVNPAVTEGDGLRVVASAGTPALDATGPGVAFGAIGATTAVKRAAVVPVQGTTDADQVGVGIYIHPDADGTQDLVRAAHFRYDGRVFIGNSDQGGTLNVSNDANPTGISTVAIVAYNPGVTATNASILRAKTEAGGGDAVVQFEISGAQTYAIGADNDDGDKFKMSKSSQVQTDTFFTYDPATGVANFNGDGTGNNWVLQTSNSIAGNVANNITNTNNASGGAHAIMDMRSGGASGGDPYFRMRVEGAQFWSHGIDNSDSDRYKFSAANGLSASLLVLDPGGSVGIGVSSTAAMLHVNQSSATGAIPVIELDQDDADQPFISFDGNEAASTSSSISTLSTPGTIQEWAMVIKGDGTKRWLALYDNPS